MLKLGSFVVLTSTTEHPNNSLFAKSNLTEQDVMRGLRKYMLQNSMISEKFHT